MRQERKVIRFGGKLWLVDYYLPYLGAWGKVTTRKFKTYEAALTWFHK